MPASKNLHKTGHSPEDGGDAAATILKRFPQAGASSDRSDDTVIYVTDRDG